MGYKSQQILKSALTGGGAKGKNDPRQLPLKMLLESFCSSLSFGDREKEGTPWVTLREAALLAFTCPAKRLQGCRITLINPLSSWHPYNRIKSKMTPGDTTRNCNWRINAAWMCSGAAVHREGGTSLKVQQWKQEDGLEWGQKQNAGLDSLGRGGSSASGDWTRWGQEQFRWS